MICWCMEDYPEDYIGEFVSAWLLLGVFVGALAMAACSSIRTPPRYGFMGRYVVPWGTACLCFVSILAMASASVITMDVNGALHERLAQAGFISYAAYAAAVVAMVTCGPTAGSTTPRSKTYKSRIAVTGVGAVVFYEAILVCRPDLDGEPPIAAIEWLAAFLVIMFTTSFALDLDTLDLGEGSDSASEYGESPNLLPRWGAGYY